MGDHKRIYLGQGQDVEAALPHATEATLEPLGVSKSYKGNPTGWDMEAGGEYYSPFQRRTIPLKYLKPPNKRSCFRKCLCWTLCLLLLLVIVLAVIGGIIYLVFQPKLPTYTVSELLLTEFNLKDDHSFDAAFDVSITAQNPNKKVGIYYEAGSRISVWSSSTELCEGGLPKFYQGHRNTTELVVTLSGHSQDATGLLTTLQQQLQETGNVPLTIRVEQPVRIKLANFKLPMIKFVVRCMLLVDSISEDYDINIQSSSCNKFGLRL